MGIPVGGRANKAGEKLTQCTHVYRVGIIAATSLKSPVGREVICLETRGEGETASGVPTDDALALLVASMHRLDYGVASNGHYDHFSHAGEIYGEDGVDSAIHSLHIDPIRTWERTLCWSSGARAT